jgi:cellobiose phosphorylase
MYRLIVESLLGLELRGETLKIDPCLPHDWSTYALNYRYRDTTYRIVVTQRGTHDVTDNVKVDGVEQTDGLIALVDDKREHAVAVSVRARALA